MGPLSQVKVVLRKSFSITTEEGWLNVQEQANGGLKCEPNADVSVQSVFQCMSRQH